MNVSIDDYSPEQLAALEKQIEVRRKKEDAEKKKKKEAYEKERNNLVDELINKARIAKNKLERLKQESLTELGSHYEKMKRYGEIHENNQGTFSIFNEDKSGKVTFAKQKRYAYDERASLAEAHLRSFLSDMVKKRSKAAYEMISGLLEKRNGQYDPQLIQKLYAYENDYDHPDFKKALSLFKESYIAVDTTSYVRFYQKDEQGKMNPIVIDFAKV